MATSISLDSIWRVIEALPLKNRKWLQAKLNENINNEETAPCQYSIEELEERLAKSIDSYERGEWCTNEELRKRYTLCK